MCFQIVIGPPHALRLDPTHPVAQKLGALLGLSDLFADLVLPAPDEEGWVDLPLPSPAPQVAFSGVVLQTTGVRLRVVDGWTLEVSAAGSLPSPLSAIALSGIVSAAGDTLQLALNPAAASTVSLAPGVSLSIPATFALRANYAGGEGRMALLTPDGSAAVLTTPGGPVFVTALEFDGQSAELAGRAVLRVRDTFEADVPDVVVRVTPGEVTLLGRGRARGRVGAGGLDVALEADTFLLRLTGAGVEECTLTGATVAGTLPLVGTVASSGALGYLREAPLTWEPPAIGQRFVLSVDSIGLPGLLAGLTPTGSASFAFWPDHDAFDIETRLRGELPLLGRFAPVQARMRKFGTPIEIELNGLTTPALSLGADLPALSLGPCYLRVELDRILSGEVTNEFGQPLPQVDVELQDAAGAALASTQTDDEGEFEFIAADPSGVRLHVTDRRVLSTTALRGEDAGGGEYGIVRIDASGAIPINVPSGFPILQGERVEIGFSWERGVGATLQLPAGLPPVEFGPLALDITSLSVSRRSQDGDVLTELTLGASGYLSLPLLTETLPVSFAEASVEWREHGVRRLSIGNATIVLPAELPVLGGAQFAASLRYSSLPEGSDDVAQELGLQADLTLVDAGAIAVAAGIQIVPANDPRLHMSMAPDASWPRFELTAGSVALGFRFGQLALHTLVLDAQSWQAGGSAQLDLGLDFVSIGPATGALLFAENSWSAQLEIAGIAVDLGPLQVSAASVGASVFHDDSADEVRIALRDVSLGPLGVQADATLVVREERTMDGSHYQAFIEAQTAWQDLPALPAPHPNFPDLPSAGTVTVRLYWQQTATGYDLSLRLSGEIEDGDRLFEFVPAAFRPQVETFAFTIDVEFAASDLSQASVSAEAALRLPDFSMLPGADLVAVSTGDAAGLVRATLAAGYEANDDGDNQAYLRFELSDAISVAMALPGMPQEEPVLEASLTQVAFELAADAGLDALAGVLRARGAFILQPPNPPPFLPLGHHMRTLLEQTGLDVIVGEIEMALGFTDDAAAIEATGWFDNAALEVDLFAMLSDMTRGLGAAPGPAGGSEIELSIEAGFELIEVSFRFGPPLEQLAAGAAGDAASFEFGLGVGFHFGELASRVDLRLSDREMALTLDRIEIPLSIPVFPLQSEDLAGLDSEADWAARHAALTAQLDAMPEPPSGKTSLERAQQAGRIGALEAIKVFWNAVAPQRRDTYLGNARFVVDVLRAATMTLHVDTDVALGLSGVGFYFPFADPSAVRVQGDAALVGFAPDDPLAFLGAIQFGLGLSADRIFFQLKTTGPIELPDFGRYRGGSIDISQLSIGYGYTRNSLAVNIAGQLVLPPQLVNDADTSRNWGAGIRLPTHNRVGFRLDLIPVTLGPVDFIVPLLEFECDMRAPYSPPVADVSRCLPYWDGLQVHVPGVFRADLKHYAFSPFFTFIPAPNLRLDWDMEIGDERNGLRVVANDFHYFAGIIVSASAILPYSMLAAPTEPYFDNLCVRLSVAGFGIQFDLERPFPGINPLALFEALGVLSDPMMRVDPNGHLASIIRVSLRHAKLMLPPAALRLFPDVPGVGKPIDVTLNLGTLITAAQTVWSAIEPVLDMLMNETGDFAARIDTLMKNPPKLDHATLLGLLPAELRKIRVHGSLGGFEAGAVLLIVTPQDARAEMRRRGVALPDAPAYIGFDAALGVEPADARHLRPVLPDTPHARRHVDVEDPANNLFSGIEFAAFDEDDLDALPAPRRRDLTGTVMGAHVTLVPGQRVRFIGALYDDGSFGLVSAVDVKSLALGIAGLEGVLPLEFHGRLTLEGRARQYRTQARVSARVSLHWDALWPAGMAVVDVPDGTLSLDSSGTFRVKGAGRVELLRGAIAMDGRVDASETHCFIDGAAEFAFGNWNGQPVFALQLGQTDSPDTWLRCRLGPGRQFTLSGEGRALVLGREVLGVRAAISERGVAVEAVVRSLRVGDWSFPDVMLALRGEIEIVSETSARYMLEGEAELVLGGIVLRGRGGLRGRDQDLSVYAEGALVWQGCRWASGRVVLGTSSLRLSGATQFSVDLTPSGSGLGTEFAHLVLQVSLEGAFALTAPTRQRGETLAALVWQLGECRLEGDCVLGVRLPSAGTGAQHDQVLPLARQRFDGALSASAPLDLLHLDDLQLLPFQGESLDITVPTFDFDTDNPHTMAVSHRTTSDAAFAFVLGNYIRVVVGDTKWYFPGTPASGTFTGEQAAVEFEVPRLVRGNDQVLSLTPSLAAAFSVRLFWSGGKLGVRVMHGSQIAFEATLDSLVGRTAHIVDLLNG